MPPYRTIPSPEEPLLIAFGSEVSYICIGGMVDPQGDKKAQGLVTIKDE
jgi:hypothetical protein